MKQLHQSGVWIGFSKEAKVGQMYKYVIHGPNGRVEHCDPYGFGMEIRPGACSIIRNLSEFQFIDNKWMKRRTRCYDQPLNIYNKCVFAYTRTDGTKNLLVLFNFSDKEAVIAPELDGKVTMILNTDWKEFHGQTDKSLKKSIPQTLPPFTGLLFYYRKF